MAKTKRPTRGSKGQKVKRNRGALTAVAVLLALSAFVRMGDHAGQALARDNPFGKLANSGEDAIDETAAPAPNIQLVLDALKVREDRVAETERQVRLRMAALEEAEKMVERRLMELRQAETSLRETLALADSAADKDIERLVAVYENMKPKEAAALFETMRPNFAAGFLARMNPQAAAGVMAGLTPDMAHAISVELAGRHSEVPTE